ncbi:hypothetical protein KC19_2G093800 [Ceratodon purpureus]|uniref:Uncharacterized protein n=1 Tax=Ceratodon purpureus TaxID=3225 RepID=A0A8T0IU17_CERPU|nr:hypothetical protein KC19_2G093800 [Ceratodon purpureus]
MLSYGFPAVRDSETETESMEGTSSSDDDSINDNNNGEDINFHSTQHGNGGLSPPTPVHKRHRLE